MEKTSEPVGSLKHEPVWIKNIKGCWYNKITKFQGVINNHDKLIPWKLFLKKTVQWKKGTKMQGERSVTEDHYEAYFK